MPTTQEHCRRIKKIIRTDLERDAKHFKKNARLCYMLREATKAEIELDRVVNGNCIAENCRLAAIVRRAGDDVFARVLIELPKGIPIDLPELLVAIMAEHLSRVDTGPEKVTLYQSEALQ